MTETILGVLAVLCLMLAVLLLFSAVHAGGHGGEVLFGGISQLVGVYAYFTPLLFLSAAYYLWKEEVPEIRILTLLGGLFLILGVGGLGTILFGTSFGGWLGGAISRPLVTNFAVVPSAFLLAGISAIGGIIFLERKPSFESASLFFSICCLLASTSSAWAPSSVRIDFAISSIRSFSMRSAAALCVPSAR